MSISQTKMENNINGNLPTVSILIATLNSANVLEKCLNSISKQNYPRERMEIIIADGGSTDNTLEIAKKYDAKIFMNPLKTGEAGKAVALKHSKNELIVLIDSDNLIISNDWLLKMVQPFSDPEIIGSEPWEFDYRKEDGFIDRYCAMIGMSDPICYFFGNYDKKSILSGKWTNLPIIQEDMGNWIKVCLVPKNIPTIGANGTIFRTKILVSENGNNSPIELSDLVKDYLFDIDMIAKLAQEKPVSFAKVKIGITHLFCGSSVKKFIRKQRRRVSDYIYYNKLNIRKYPWQNQNNLGLLKFILFCITIFPLIFQSIKGYIKKPDIAWFFHPLACLLTFWVYSLFKIVSIFKISEVNREGWKQ